MRRKNTVRLILLARALFQGENLRIVDTIFADGESPLKESHDIELVGCMFKWKYPLWYAKNITAKSCTWFEMGRAGVWYTKHITVEDSAIEAPKNFRRCEDVTLKNVSFPNAAETLWHCDGVTMEQVTAKGDYFAMNSQNMNISGLTLYGNYSFDGARNVEIHDSRLLSKDAFWNSENVTVYDSFISGEYLGWNAKNLTLINCTVESLQGMCYIDNLVMKNCRLLNTTLAFEYSTVDANIVGKIDSVLNPSGGMIKADSIAELIIEKDKVDPEKTKIVCRQSYWRKFIKSSSALNFLMSCFTVSEGNNNDCGIFSSRTAYWSGIRGSGRRHRCIDYSAHLGRGLFAGLVTGAGSSAVDLIYSCAGVFGITIIADFITAHQVVIRLIGGFVILLLGAVILRKKELHSAQPDTKGTPIFFFLSAFTAATMNPATILSFMVAFTAFGIQGNLDAYQGIALILGILAGTLCWWSALSGVVAHFRKRVTNNIYKWLNRILGCLMTLFSVIMMLQGFMISF